MLYEKTLPPSALEFLKGLQQKEYLKGFHLAGGSGLALHYGHRESVDLDLFSNFNFDAEKLRDSIDQNYSYQLFFTAESTLKGRIENINVDIIAHRYPYINDPITENGIRVVSEQDILAMKLNAISISGQRSKDFIDLYYGLKLHSMSDLINFYKLKYDQQNVTHVLKSLVYFEDVDLADWPVIIDNPSLKWKTVMNKIESEVQQIIESD